MSDESLQGLTEEITRILKLNAPDSVKATLIYRRAKRKLDKAVYEKKSEILGTMRLRHFPSPSSAFAGTDYYVMEEEDYKVFEKEEKGQ